MIIIFIFFAAEGLNIAIYTEFVIRPFHCFIGTYDFKLISTFECPLAIGKVRDKHLKYK